MKILFLDIDGVLNNDFTKERLDASFGVFKGCVGIDQRLLKLFKDWLNQQTDLSIILSSSWRNYEGLRLAVEKELPIAGVTGSSRESRETEIFEWLQQNIELEDKFAILDDLNVGSLQKFAVQTSPKHGLRPKNLKRLDILLGDKNG